MRQANQRAEYLKAYEAQRLCQAVLDNNEIKVRELVEAGADVRAVDLWEVTPLHLAAQLGHEGVARVLVEAGADVRAPDFRRNTPLHVAVLGGHEGAARVLVEAGADVRALDGDENTPLHLAAQEGYEGVARVLVEAGTDVRAVNRYQYTPLHIAAELGHEGVARVLVDGGADVRALDRWRDTPLHLAAEGGHEGVARVLVKVGADVIAVNSDQRTPLHLAAMNGREGVARVLVEGRANVRARDLYGRTPLQVAAENGHEETARALVEGGAKLVTCVVGPGGAQEGSDSSSGGKEPTYENYRKTTSANKEMDMASLLGNESKVSREDLHAHYLFVYGEYYKEILDELNRLKDGPQQTQKKGFEEEEEQKQEDSDYPSENKSKHNEFMQELLEAEMNPSRGSIPLFFDPEVNEKTADMSLPKDGAIRQDQDWFLDTEVKRVEPRLDFVDMNSNFAGLLPGDHGFDAHQAGMLALAMGVLSGVSGVPIIDGGVLPAVAA